MSNRLSSFLIRLSEDLKLQKRYAIDAEGVMNDAALSEADKAALQSGDEAEIYKAAGVAPGFVVAKIVSVFKPAQSQSLGM